MNTLVQVFCPFLSRFSEQQGFIAIPCVKEGEGICIFYDRVKMNCKFLIMFDNIDRIAVKHNEKK